MITELITNEYNKKHNVNDEFSTKNDKMVNNWWFCLDAYKDLCGCFEAKGLFCEIRVRPNKENWSVKIISGAEYSNQYKKIRRTLYKGSRSECNEKLKQIIKNKRPENYIKKLY